MKVVKIEDALSETRYPGRGIILGANENGDRTAVYFIMGRSESSRNRVFLPTTHGIRTQAYDETKLVNPLLTIYTAVREQNGYVVVTNGDQTDTICDHLISGGSFETALYTRAFEPDPPHYTPRISGIMSEKNYRLAILKSADGDPAACLRQFFDYDKYLNGVGHYIHTYSGEGDPLKSFRGEPEAVALEGTAREICERAWAALDPEYRVSIYARVSNPRLHSADTYIINANRLEEGKNVQ